MTTFERIKKLAKMRGYSLSSLNDKAGLGTNSIYHWKTKAPNITSLKKVADVLGVPVDSLLEDNNETSKSNISADDEMFFRTVLDKDGMSDKQYQEYRKRIEQFARFARSDIENDIQNGK
ncbi:helix-turn-helix transcriptional regulator [Lactobacillus sp. LC28-10]|uniref:Helix-turn-helix transcriptional regulator n=1 Tax=Secundilactobacillus angelensis TaxID=2722706 RepID=A0ABX1L2C0_9LACO|nr:helix-turn-helix transcriptional regulator [Secundilactobacillus angelensis]MCH5463226.1 helix-turn-helix transcriptional regulator [Secundilactobacillus angelensis]NLR19627.1 helix-turn-helix transcriptional regulator [Secundilactobacillus angelensis]